MKRKTLLVEHLQTQVEHLHSQAVHSVNFKTVFFLPPNGSTLIVYCQFFSVPEQDSPHHDPTVP